METNERGTIRIISKTHKQTADKITWNATKNDISLTSGNEVKLCGQEEGIKLNSYNEVEKKEADFNILFSLDQTQQTVVPFGISDFKGNFENPCFWFNYSLVGEEIDSLHFKIEDEKGNIVYALGYLPNVVVKADTQSLLFSQGSKKPSTLKLWDYGNFLRSLSLSEPDYTKPGTYQIAWDGFDNNEVYDSSIFAGKTLKAKLKAVKGAKQKTIEITFSTHYKEVSWVDVKIDRKNKRIDTTLRVDLRNGGEKGLEKWDSIPKKELAKYKQPPITLRTRTHNNLEKMALDGLSYHWGRNKNHAEGKDVKINNNSYEVFLIPINIKKDSMEDVELVYNTNRGWMRSGNPGTIEDPISFVGNIISRQAVCYNVGYIEYSNGWGYQVGSNEDLEFTFTAAHEIGHTILKAYGGTFYSYGHKGTVNTYTQRMKDSAPNYPSSGEIDIMPYYPQNPPYSMYNRYEASEKDVLSLIWLTKLEIS